LSAGCARGSWAKLPGRLDATYSEIHAVAPHARVVVVGYPNL
jgi:hypothetical protein